MWSTSSLTGATIIKLSKRHDHTRKSLLHSYILCYLIYWAVIKVNARQYICTKLNVFKKYFYSTEFAFRLLFVGIISHVTLAIFVYTSQSSRQHWIVEYKSVPGNLYHLVVSKNKVRQSTRPKMKASVCWTFKKQSKMSVW